MSNVYVERQDDGTYKATQNGRTVATGKTQEQAATRAQNKKPDDPILVERVRNTTGGRRDKWRRF